MLPYRNATRSVSTTPLLGEAGANIVAATHQRIFSHLPARSARLDLVIETRDRGHLDEAVAKLKGAGFQVQIGRNSKKTMTRPNHLDHRKLAWSE
jgi:hypothetical protein